MSKNDFKDFADAQRYLYGVMQKLEHHDLSASEASSLSKVVDSWTKVHKLKTNADIIKRIDGLETLYKAKKG
jgi:hypothetical protein